MSKRIISISLILGMMFVLNGCFLFGWEELYEMVPNPEELEEVAEDPLMAEIDFFVENAVTDEDQEEEEEEGVDELAVVEAFQGNWVMTLDVEGMPVVSELYIHPASKMVGYYLGQIDTIRSYVGGEVLEAKDASASYTIMNGQELGIEAHDLSSSFSGAINIDGSKPYASGTFYFSTGQSGAYSMQTQD